MHGIRTHVKINSYQTSGFFSGLLIPSHPCIHLFLNQKHLFNCSSFVRVSEMRKYESTNLVLFHYCLSWVFSTFYIILRLSIFNFCKEIRQSTRGYTDSINQSVRILFSGIQLFKSSTTGFYNFHNIYIS